MLRIKIIIFDFDGVIVESLDIKTRAFARLFKAQGKRVVRKVVDYHLQNTGVSRYDKFRHIYKKILRRPLNQNTFQMLCDRFSDAVMDLVTSARYVKGAKEFLEGHASEYRCFLISATPQEEVEKIIKKRKMERFFVEIYGAPRKKINAVKDILRKEKIKPLQVLYVGDAMSDYIAAQKNKIHFIARIYGKDKIFNKIDCIKIKDLSRLYALIKNF